MIVNLPYGKQCVPLELPDHADVVFPKTVSGVADARAEIRKAMDHPIGSMPLPQIAHGKSDAVVIINDFTRPTPTDLMLDEILTDLSEAGISDDQVTVLIACGNHRPTTKEEMRHMVGPELSDRVRFVNHDCKDEAQLTFVGTTDGGLPIWIHSLVAQASLKILTGLITPHHGAGYSGGRKSLIPGVAGLKTLHQHHAFPIRPYLPAMGWMRGNPFHEEAVNGAKMVGVDFIVNVVKTPSGKIAKAVAGDLVAAHEKGVEICEDACGIPFSHRYDVVIVTPGGHPRDVDLHQSQKAMSVAELVLAEQGILILVAQCPEGIGKFAEWLKSAKSPEEVIERFRVEGFTEDQSSKAFMCARVLKDHPVIVSCSGIDENELEQMFFQHAPSPQEGLDRAVKTKGPHPRVLVLPYAVDCVPKLQE
jgi:lactate racemase